MTERNGNSFHRGHHWKTLRMMPVSAISRQFGSGFGLFDIAAKTKNILTLSVDIKFICTRYEIGQKSSSKAHFSTTF